MGAFDGYVIPHYGVIPKYNRLSGAHSIPTPKPPVGRLELDAMDIAAIKKWKGGSGFKPNLATSIDRQGWISPKQRIHLHSRDCGTKSSRGDSDSDYSEEDMQRTHYDVGYDY